MTSGVKESKNTGPEPPIDAGRISDLRPQWVGCGRSGLTVPPDQRLEQADRTPHSYAMAHEALSLADRWARLRISTKAFAVASSYMLAMVALSEIAGDGLLLIWFATALPISWCGGLLLHWASMRPCPSLDEASKGIVAQAKAKPILLTAYVLAAVVIEAFAVIEALKADR
jgi:hypothetical protein